MPHGILVSGPFLCGFFVGNLRGIYGESMETIRESKGNLRGIYGESMKNLWELSFFCGNPRKPKGKELP